MAGTTTDRGAAVRAVVAELRQVPEGTVTGATRLTEDLAMDSMSKLELAVTLEVRLGRPVSDTIVMKAKTVDDLVEALER